MTTEALTIAPRELPFAVSAMLKSIERELALQARRLKTLPASTASGEIAEAISHLNASAAAIREAVNELERA